MAVKLYHPEKVTDKQLPFDFKNFGGWYSTLKDTGEFKYSKSEILNTFLIPDLKEIIKRGKMEFHPGNWKDNQREIYLEAFSKVADKGLYLVEPHGQMIAENTKKAIVKAKKFIAGAFYLLVSGKKAYGFIRLEQPKEIGLDEFKKLETKHQISEQERLKWWKGKEKLFAYEIRDFIPLPKPQEVRVPKEVRTFFNIKLSKLSEARHSVDRCMKCSKAPEYEVLWANGRGHVWFCKECLTQWALHEDGKNDIQGVKEIKDGKAKDKFKDNPNPNIWDKLKPTLKEAIEFKPDEWTVEIYLKASGEKLLKMHDKLLEIWQGRGSRKNDELVINADALLISEMKKRNLKWEVNELDKIVKSDLKEGIIQERASKILEKVKETGSVVITPNYISITGSSMFATKRLPNDIDIVIRSDKISSALGLKLDKVIKEVLGVEPHLVPESSGPNWRWMGMYDLVLVPKEEMEIHEVDKKDFRDKFYETVEDIDLLEEIDSLATEEDYFNYIYSIYDIDKESLISCIKEQYIVEPLKKIKGRIPIVLKEIFKKNPKDYEKNFAIMINHFRGKSVHIDFRRKQNGFLEGETLLNEPEGLIDEPVRTLKDAKKWTKELLKKGKFRPDMDPNKKVVMVEKKQQPLEWLNIRDVVLEPGSVGATRFEPGVFDSMDDGMAYPGVQKPFFKEFFLDMRHFKGRMVERLIPAERKGEPKPKSPVIWQAWTNMVDQTPYILNRRARIKKDYIPKEGESALPPEWENKIKPELRWWTKGLSSSERMKRLQLAYNDLIERKILKGRIIENKEVLVT